MANYLPNYICIVDIGFRDIRLNCTLWGEHVDIVQPYYNSNIDSGMDGPLIVMIQCCRARLVDGIGLMYLNFFFYIAILLIIFFNK